MNRVTRPSAILAAALLTGLAAACTTTSSGEPRPEDKVTETSDESDPSTSSEELPERPRDIKLDSVDPCALLPQTDYSDYYVEKPGKPKQESNGANTCIWFTDIGYFAITLETTMGIEARLDGSTNVQGEVVDPIEGFGAVTYNLPNDDNACFVAVDVADGQSLVVQVGLDTSRPVDLPPICEYTHQFAASAMSTLVES